jgi:C4-dicarboxylate transporter DctQ subunit
MSEPTAAPPASAPGVGGALAGVALAILLANVALIAFDVLMRWLFRSPQSWVSDLAQLSYPVAIACCMPAALESGHMIAIRFLGEALGPRAARGLDLFGQSALIAVLALFAWKMVGRAASDWRAGFKTSTIDLPVAPTWMLVAGLLILCTLIQLRLTWRTLTHAG